VLYENSLQKVQPDPIFHTNQNIYGAVYLKNHYTNNGRCKKTNN
jgi:hypothetical protein